MYKYSDYERILKMESSCMCQECFHLNRPCMGNAQSCVVFIETGECKTCIDKMIERCPGFAEDYRFID